MVVHSKRENRVRSTPIDLRSISIRSANRYINTSRDVYICLPIKEMTEDIVGDGSAEFGDDFSLASGIDKINYDDPFDSNNNNNNSDGVEIVSKKYESLTMLDSTFNTKNQETSNLRKGPPKIIGVGVGVEPNACLFKTSSDERKISQIVHNCNQSSFYLSSCKQPTMVTKLNPQNVSLVENRTSGLVMNRKEMKKKKKQQSSSSILKSEIVPVKARKMSTKNTIKLSKSDGLLTLALKAKYSNSTAQQLRNVAISSSSSGYSLPHPNALDGIGDNSELASGKANASWHNSSGSQTHTDFVGGLGDRGYSLPPVKSSSMHDLLLQSKAQCRSQFLLRQSSAHALSKRNSFQSIKYVNEKPVVSALSPVKPNAKSRSASRRWSLPNVASATTKSKCTMKLMSGDEVEAKTISNGSIGDMTDSLLHEACRLFPNSDTVMETALRVDPDAIRRSVVYTSIQDGDTSRKTKISMYGYPINLALTYGASEKILTLLVKSGSDVLTFKDGTNCGASLGIALSLKQCSLVIVNILLSANDQCAQIADRRGNYPLHIAVRYGRSVDIVIRLYVVYPEAQGMRNFHSQTPLDIAIQSTRCPEEVTDFLRSVACRPSCANNTIMNTKKADYNQSFEYLEDGLDDIMQINY